MAVEKEQSKLEALLTGVSSPSAEHRRQAQVLLDAKTKPRGSLGFLEDLAVTYAGIRHEERPEPARFAVVVAAADHGVSDRGVSAYPPEVTSQMIANIAAGGAAVSVLAAQGGVRLVVVDAGSRAEAVPPGVLDARTGRGSADIVEETALGHQEVTRLVLSGAELARQLAADGITALALGEMGIGNSTVAAALTSALLDLPADQVTGPGTGVGGDALAAKTDAVARAVSRWRSVPGGDRPMTLLGELGGADVAFLAGVVLGAAGARMPVVLDGFIATSAALVARALAPRTRDVLIAGHRSTEPGHRRALRSLGLRPVLELDMRLGEGSGAVLACSVIGSAVAVLTQMASFEAAGVTDSGA